MEIKHHHVQLGENFKQKIYLKNKVVSIIIDFFMKYFLFYSRFIPQLYTN